MTYEGWMKEWKMLEKNSLRYGLSCVMTLSDCWWLKKIKHINKNEQKLLHVSFDDYGLQIMKNQNSVSQKIRILHKINKKSYF